MGCSGVQTLPSRRMKYRAWDMFSALSCGTYFSGEDFTSAMNASAILSTSSKVLSLFLISGMNA